MIAIQLQFLTGKLHTTPWGRQVNEGAVEWPPAPWRILRALLAVWRNKFPKIPESEISELIIALSEIPSFWLPPATHGHTRHYMPTSKKPVLIFDTFLVIPRNERLIICWRDARLADPQLKILKNLLEAMNYFGRAESWVDAKLLENFVGELNTVPLSENATPRSGHLERVLAVEPSEKFDRWRSETITKLQQTKLNKKRQRAKLKGKSVDELKLTSKENKSIEAEIPNSLLAALQIDSSALRKAGWNRPPGSRIIEYIRPTHALNAPVRVRPIRGGDEGLPTLARYAVTGKVVPRLTDALRIGERARTFLMGCSKRVNLEAGREETTSPVFAGKNPDGSKLADAHSHAHYLCEALGSSSQITHLNVYAPAGFDSHDQAALARFNRTWGDQGHDLQFVLLGIGRPKDFGGFTDAVGESKCLAVSHSWVSRTPYIPARHLKIKSSERTDPATFQAAIRRELAVNLRLELKRRPQFEEVAEAIEIEISDHTAATSLGGNRVRWLEFSRERKNGKGHKGSSVGYGVRLVFPRRISGPLALGYGCHFGLGQFVAD